MTLVIDLKPELEAKVREEAAKTGVDTGTFVVHALEERFQQSVQRLPSHLSPEESALLKQINQGLPETIWQEYHDLVARRRAETLTSEEQARLIALSDNIEQAHADRVALVAELAGRWHVSLKTLMGQLGIKPRKV